METFNLTISNDRSYSKKDVDEYDDGVKISVSDLNKHLGDVILPLGNYYEAKINKEGDSVYLSVLPK